MTELEVLKEIRDALVAQRGSAARARSEQRGELTAGVRRSEVVGRLLVEEACQVGGAVALPKRAARPTLGPCRPRTACSAGRRRPARSSDRAVRGRGRCSCPQGTSVVGRGVRSGVRRCGGAEVQGCGPLGSSAARVVGAAEGYGALADPERPADADGRGRRSPRSTAGSWSRRSSRTSPAGIVAALTVAVGVNITPAGRARRRSPGPTRVIRMPYDDAHAQCPDRCLRPAGRSCHPRRRGRLADRDDGGARARGRDDRRCGRARRRPGHEGDGRARPAQCGPAHRRGDPDGRQRLRPGRRVGCHGVAGGAGPGRTGGGRAARGGAGRPRRVRLRSGARRGVPGQARRGDGPRGGGGGGRLRAGLACARRDRWARARAR